MGSESPDDWICVDPKTKKLCIRFRCQSVFGNKQQYIGYGLKDTPENRQIVRIKRDQIKNDIKYEFLDPTLEKYRLKPAKNFALVKATELAPFVEYKYDIPNLWELFTDFQKTQLEETTIRKRYKTIENHINRLLCIDLNQAPSIRNEIIQNVKPYSAHRLLGHLSQCCEWAVNSRLIPDNPFEKLTLPKPKKQSHEGDTKAFTLQEREFVIEAFTNHPTWKHYAPLIKFLFWTGCRSGEAFALTWGDINEDCTKILISKSRNNFGITKGTKNKKTRTFSTAKETNLSQLLLEIKPPNVDHSELVFKTRDGRRLNSRRVNDMWYGRTSIKPSRKYFTSGVVKNLVEQGKISRYLCQYSTRHTFITWAIASGITPEKVAKLVGDTTATILKFYVHPNVVEFDCPDF